MGSKSVGTGYPVPNSYLLDLLCLINAAGAFSHTRHAQGRADRGSAVEGKDTAISRRHSVQEPRKHRCRHTPQVPQV